MPEKEITKKVTEVIKDLDKLVQDAENALKSLKKLKGQDPKDVDKV